MKYVIFSAATGRLRRIVVDTQLTIQQIGVGLGEQVLAVPQAVYGDQFKLQTFITQQTGLIPQDDRYVVVDAQNKVIEVQDKADPECGDGQIYQQRNCLIIKSPDAAENWTYDPVVKKLIAPVAPVVPAIEAEAALKA